MMDILQIERCAQLIQEADSLLITAGAGMGVDSGLPDFRGKDGFWEVYPALARAGLGFTHIANPAEFVSNPRRAWGFYGHRLQLYRETVPHAGFGILKTLSKHMAHGVFVFTSNVDGQFQKAGFDPERIVEAHGSIHHLQCIEECCGDLWSAEGFDPVVDNERCELLSEFPRCPHCGGIARPNILMFGDWNWRNTRCKPQTVAMNSWLQKVQNLVVIEIGAGSDIPTVRYKSENVGGTLIRINPREPEGGDDKALSIKLGGLDALQKILAVK